MRNKFNLFLDKINIYFSIPFIIMLFLSYIYNQSKNSIVGTICSIVLTIFFCIYLYYVILKLIKIKIKDLTLIWSIIICFICLIFSYILSYNNEVQISNNFFIFGTFCFEIYAYYIILKNCLSEKFNITIVVLFSSLFLIFGYSSIFFSTYYLIDKTLFNSLITLFSSIVGGSITLIGVAWTIKNETRLKEKESQRQAEPYFSMNLVYHEPKNLETIKVCLADDYATDKRYEFSVCSEIENSNHSVVVLKRVFHDNKWFEFEGNTILIQQSKVLLSFMFESPLDIFLEVEDEVNIKHYYKLNVLSTSLIGGSGGGLHTIKDFKKVDISDIFKIEKSNQ